MRLISSVTRSFASSDTSATREEISERLAADDAHGPHGGLPSWGWTFPRPTALQRPTWANVGAHRVAVGSTRRQLLPGRFLVGRKKDFDRV
jgi:hypothetical protein